MAAKQYSSAAKKEAVKKELPKSYAKLTELAAKARVEVERILKIIGKEADLSSKVLKGRVDILNIDTRIDKQYRELGKESYNLVEKGKVDNSELKSIVSEINELYKLVDKKKKQVDKLKQEMRKAAKASS